MTAESSDKLDEAAFEKWWLDWRSAHGWKDEPHTRKFARETYDHIKGVEAMGQAIVNTVRQGMTPVPECGTLEWAARWIEQSATDEPRIKEFAANMAMTIRAEANSRISVSKAAFVPVRNTNGLTDDQIADQVRSIALQECRSSPTAKSVLKDAERIIRAGVRSTSGALPPVLDAAMNELDDFLNNAPQYEEKLRVRDFRAEAYPKWVAVVKAIRTAFVSTTGNSDHADAERWRAFCSLWAASTEMKVAQDENGEWSIMQVEDVEGERFGKLTGATPDAAIDNARSATGKLP